MTTVKVEKVDGKTLGLRYNFDATVNNVLTAVVPGTIWDPKARVWKVAASPLQIDRLNVFRVKLLEMIPGATVEVTKEAEDLANEVVAEYHKDPIEFGTTGTRGPDKLFSFQRQVVDYVKERRNVLVAMSMGLGKTVTALKSVQELGIFPVAVICPASVKEHWKREVEKWIPGKTVTILSGRKPKPEDVEGADVIVLNYDIVKGRLPDLKDTKALVVDEAHMVKNPSAKRSQAVERLSMKKEAVILLTGTPIINRHYECWMPMRVLGHEADFGGFRGFTERYCPPRTILANGREVTLYKWSTRGEEFHKMLRWAGMIRVNRDDVIEDLPPLNRTVIPVQITNRREYKKAEKDFLEWIAERMKAEGADIQEIAEKLDAAESGGIFVKMGALKRVAAEGKVRDTIEIVENAVEEGESVVVFTVHRSVALKVHEELGKKNISSSIVTGATPTAERAAESDAFQKGDVPVFIGTIGAMGTGVELTKATTMVFAEMGWTPGEHDQAEARAYARLGDMHGLNVYYIVGEKTMDEYVWETVMEKRDVFATAVDGKKESDYQFDVVRKMIGEVQK